jgi:hypothetical protein
MAIQALASMKRPNHALAAEIYRVIFTAIERLYTTKENRITEKRCNLSTTAG